MRRWMWTLAATVGLLVGVAAAQPASGYVGGGVAVGFPGGSPSFGFTVQLGGEGLIAPDLGVRASLEVALSPFALSAASADLYARLPFQNLSLYLGAGPDLYRPDLIGSGGFSFGAHALAGLEFAASRNLGFYAETSPGLVFGGGGPVFVIDAGAGLRFRF